MEIWQALLENSLDAVITINDEGKVIFWNKQAEEIFGWKKSEVLDKRLSELIIPPALRKKHEEGLKHFLTTGEGPILNRRIEIMAVKKDGSEIQVEKMRLEQAIQARDEFIGLCSHELKTPVTSMKIQYQLADKMIAENNPRVYDPEVISKRIYIANKQLTRMSKLIDNMIDVSNISRGGMSYAHDEINLFDLTKSVLDEYEDQFEILHIKINFHLEDGLVPKIFGDAFRVEQVISNLLVNAIKYGERKPIDIEITSHQDRVSFSMTDHGMGIDPNNQKRIFDRFERAISGSEVSGLGLGLYISRQIIEAHHGTLTVKSEKGKGSTFMFELPLIRPEIELSQ